MFATSTQHYPWLIYTIGSVMMMISAVFSTLFCVLYQFTAPWWRSTEGRHVMSFVAAIAAVCDLFIVKAIFGDSTCFQVFRLLIFSSIPLVLVWRVWLLYVVQIKPYRRQRRQRGQKGRVPVDH